MLQGTSAQYKGIHDCVMKIIREEGAGTFFQVPSLSYTSTALLLIQHELLPVVLECEQTYPSP